MLSITCTRKQFVTFSATLIISVGIVLFPNVATAAPKETLADQLLLQAQKKVDTEYKALVSGDTTELVKPVTDITGRAAERKNDIATTQLRRHKMLADHGQKYTKTVAKLTIDKADIGTDKATINATELVTLTLEDKNVTSPIYTKEIKNHVLSYVKEGGKWKLTEDSVYDGFAPIIPDVATEKLTTQPLSLDTNVKSNTPQTSQKSVSSESLAVAAATSGTFNRSAAANYARSYWNTYNSAYRSYQNDCTNFTSQALNWAGWQHVGGMYDNANYWWYSPSIVLQWGARAESRSWINVHYFYFFARYSNRGTNAQELSQFDLGDNFHFDFATPDGVLDHNAIVTKNNGAGNIFLTYHSVNTLDISIWDVIARTPGANYYGTLMKTTY